MCDKSLVLVVVIFIMLYALNTVILYPAVSSKKNAYLFFRCEKAAKFRWDSFLRLHVETTYYGKCKLSTSPNNNEAKHLNQQQQSTGNKII